MKSVYRYCLMLGIGGLLIVAAGCNKLEDYLGKDPLATYDKCRVEKMILTYFTDPIDMVVNYNSYGDPVSVMQSGGAGTGRPNMIFKYDNKRRLTDYIGAYSNGGFEYWHQYVYDNKGRVIRDTTYLLGWIDNDKPADYYDGAVIYYEYDQYGRITHTTQDWWSPGPSLEFFYSYDAKGNLVLPGVTYDNKISIHRTHRVWMFIDRNYSLNNAHATAWNEHGLPTKLNQGVEDFNGTQFAGYYNGKFDTIIYKCKGDSPF